MLQKRLELAQSLADMDMHLNGHREVVREACIRSRAGFKGFFGRNSNQYSLAGGTRMMDRKSPRRAASGTTDSSTTAKQRPYPSREGYGLLLDRGGRGAALSLTARHRLLFRILMFTI